MRSSWIIKLAVTACAVEPQPRRERGEVAADADVLDPGARDVAWWELSWESRTPRDGRAKALARFAGTARPVVGGLRISWDRP